MTAIIIGFTPFHLLPIRELIATLEDDLHVFHPMASKLRGSAEGRPPVFLGGCDSPRGSRWSHYFRARREIDRMMACGEQVDLYLPHPFNPLSNHVFFHNRPIRRFIYQDGILNYYDAATPLASFSARMRQRVKAAVIGARYRLYGGHLSGIDSRPVAGGFFTHPDLVVSADKFPALRRLTFRSIERTPDLVDVGDVLFLDQPVELVVGAERACELRRRTAEYIDTLGARVLYKPHYAQGRERSLGPRWMPLAPELSALPAEWALARIRVAHVVSFCTSALANIAMSDRTITCHATAANLVPVSVNGRRTTLAEVLSGLGVKVVELLQS
ncbi:MAG TPA: hypothetical protein VJ833_03155 [Rhodanobacteraceae bacterium]|nr:hypothetical protein [Rhodanobacteraceae bacterium]